MTGADKSVPARGRYEAPAYVGHFPLIWWAWFGVLAALILVGTYYRWWAGQRATTMSQAALTLAVFAALFIAMFIADYIVRGSRRVLAADWDENGVVLHTARKGPVTIPWAGIDHVTVPPRLGVWFLPALWSAADLFAVGEEAAFRIALSWDSNCESFLSVLAAKVRVVPGIGGKPW